jgi:FMN-dependent NADH-azoreductase
VTSVLLISSSASGKRAISNQITRALLVELRRIEPGLRLVERDVGVAPLPHLTPERLPALAGNTDTAPALETATQSRASVDEVMAADLIVIGSPMYNLGITSTLKAWFDHVARAGQTFRYTADGPEGLLRNKRAIVVVTRGGLYSDGPARAMDFQQPHLMALLTFIGITDVTFVRAERLAISADVKAASVETAIAQARAVARRTLNAALPA